jgi:hypothetical protein
MLKRATAGIALAAALAAPAAAAAATRPGDQALANRIVLRGADLPGAQVAPPATGLSRCAHAGQGASGIAYGPFLFFGRAEVTSAATVYPSAARAQASAQQSASTMSSPCLGNELADDFALHGAKFVETGRHVAPFGGGIRVRITFFLRDRRGRTGSGVYDVVVLRRGRSVAGFSAINPIDERWERGLVAKLAARCR